MWHKAVDFATIVLGSSRCNICLLLLSSVIFSLCALFFLCLCTFWVLVTNELYAFGMFHRITLLFVM